MLVEISLIFGLDHLRSSSGGIFGGYLLHANLLANKIGIRSSNHEFGLTHHIIRANSLKLVATPHFGVVLSPHSLSRKI